MKPEFKVGDVVKQTVPEGHTAGVSNTQRYRQLGNGWTIDVIVHILKGAYS